MQKPGTHRIIPSLAIFLILISGASVLVAGLRWVARTYAAGNAGPVAQGCTLNCSATVPATGQVGAPVAFTASASASGCAGAPVYEWNFGDNTPISMQQNPSHVYTAPGTYNWALTTRAPGGGAALIETVAGGLGEGNPAGQVSFTTLVAVARDPQGRGLYIAEEADAGSLIRFINLGAATATIAGVPIAPGAVRLIAGGGLDFGENVKGLDTDLGTVTGLGVSPNGQLLYFVDAFGRRVRALNTTANSVLVAGVNIGSGNIGTVTSPSAGFGSILNGLSVNPTNGDIFVADATNSVNKVFRITPAGAVTTVAGNGANTTPDETLPSGSVVATETPLMQPRAVKADASGNVFIADTGHGRVVRVDPAGSLTLVRQFQTGPIPPNPYPSGLTLFGGNLYVANGNALTIMRITGGIATVAGLMSTACDYSISNCGDGGSGAQAAFNFLSSINLPPLAGIESDGGGLFILDQGAVERGRVRYLNLSGSPTTVGGVMIGPNQINTIAGAGMEPPYDQGLATSAVLNTPTGVAATAQGDLFIAETSGNRLRFVNRGASAVTIFAGTPAAQNVAPGQIVTINKDAGAGPGDGAPVNTAFFDSPQGLAATAQGIFIVDAKRGPNVPPTFQGRRTGLIRFVNTTGANVTFYPSASSPIVVQPGFIVTIAGGGTSSTSIGNGGVATSGRLVGPSDVAISPISGDLYIADVGNKAVRKINRNTGVITSLGLAAAQYTGLGFDASGRLYVVNTDANTLLRETAAGSGSFDTLATGLNRPRDVAIDASGAAYVTNTANHRILQVSPTGSVSGFAGTSLGFAGDGGPPANARLNLNTPLLTLNSSTTVPVTVGITTGPGADLFLTDSGNHRIRRLGLSGGAVTCSRTGSITISVVQNPAPTITGLNPNSATVGGPAFMLTVNGANFIAGSVVRWNGANRTTNVVNGTQLTAQIPASDIASAGPANVTVFNPAPGGGVSNMVTFNTNNPVPQLNSLSPNQAQAGAAAFTLTINGANFISSSVVRWNGTNRPTTFVSGTQLTADIPVSDIAAAGVASVMVFNPVPGGGSSNALSLTINNPAPAITSLNPNPVSAGAPAFTLTVNGSNFVAGSVVRWNGSDRTTSFVSGTQLTAQISASDIATAGSASVTVFNSAPGGGPSNALSLTINNPAPAISSINPSTASTGGPAFTLTINGSNFVAGSVVRVNGSDRTTSFVNGTQITAQIPASDIATVGAASVTVFNPAPGGGSSSALSLTINNPTPAITSINPNTASAGGPAFTLTINGSNFVTGSIVRWNGGNRSTNFVSATQVTAQIPASDIAAAGSASVTVFNPSPGGGLSAALPITINQSQTPRVVRVVNSGGAPGGAAQIPIELVSQGDENAIGFSLSFPTATLSNPQVALGSDASTGLLNVNTGQASQGRLGISMALPAGQRFTAGARQVVIVTFTIAPNASGGAVAINFIDQPIAREIVDVVAATLPANYVSGTVTVTPGFEGDTSPRPNGNGSLTISDWVLLGRFATGLETVEMGSEFQRADCAPRSSLGDGRLTLSDWVQGGRYSAGLDPITPAGGPTMSASGVLQAAGSQRMREERQVQPSRAVRALATTGEPNSMTIFFDARGDENAISFSLQYDPTRLRFAGAELGPELGPDLENAALLINIRKLSSGRVGMMLALSPGRSFRAGGLALLTVRFTMAVGGSPTVARVSFGDEPFAREAADIYARPAQAVWSDFEIPVNARASASVSAASYKADAIAPGAILAAFGDGLAETTQTAATLPLPLELAGTRVITRDSAGVERLAPLFFVSLSQINYLTPPETAAGLATVTITRGDGMSFSEVVEIAPAAPGLFTANADGQGVAAAVALRVKPDGSMHYEPVAHFDGARGRYAAAPVVLGDEDDQVYLLLFGTGIRSFGSLETVKATIGGDHIQVMYAGEQGDFAGLDQITLRLPRSLSGRGEMDVRLTVAGRSANVVQVNIW